MTAWDMTNLISYITVIYLPFGSTESKGLTGLIFKESQDKIKSPLHIFEQFSIVFVSIGTHLYKFCESQRQGCEYMKQDSQVKKITDCNFVQCFFI